LADTKNREYNIHDYDDIIRLPHHSSAVHSSMPVKDRAAQFAPFAALTGHGERIRETAHMAEEKAEEKTEEKIEDI